MNIPLKVKADLWEAKHSTSAPTSVVETNPEAANGDMHVRPGARGGDCVYFDEEPWVRYGGHRDPVLLDSPVQVAIEKDYWLAYTKAKSQHRTENMMAAALLSLWGFPGGLILWVFHRLIRFAVKG